MKAVVTEVGGGAALGDRSYLGIVGNGETAALIAPDLAVRWLCLNRFDGTPLFASALDPNRGGALAVRLLDAAGQPIHLVPGRQAYQGDTALLRSTAAGEGWQVEVVDFMPWGRHGLVRELHITNRTGAPASVRVEPVVTGISAAAFPVAVESVTREALSDQVTALIYKEGVALVTGGGAVTVSASDSATLRLYLAYGSDKSSAQVNLRALEGATAQAEAAFWAEWIGQAEQPEGALPANWLAYYRRSLIVMKLLSYEPTGALIAAPTATFPAVPGGSDNWDYRFAWLRDGYYTALSFDAAGLHAEAARFYDFAFSLQGPDGHWRQPLYTVDGADPAEFIAEDLTGPGGEVPVRFGNAASGQLQLDNEGNILHGLWFHFQASGDRGILERHWEGVRRAANWTAANWGLMESGIWELREYVAHWVHGKAICYAALEAAAAIATELGHAAEAAAWRQVAKVIRRDVVEHGWNEERQAYLRHYGEGAPAPCVDISVLALVFYGLLPPEDPRIVATVALLERPQAEGGLGLLGGYCRYDYGAVPFYLPTLWLARYYLMAGRLADCDRLLQTCLECATELGLMAEHFDGESRRQWGNFPQDFSHEEVARLVLERGVGRPSSHNLYNERT